MDKKPPKWSRSTICLSRETLRQVEELEESFGESRSRVISRALDLLYAKHQQTAKLGDRK